MRLWKLSLTICRCKLETQKSQWWSSFQVWRPEKGWECEDSVWIAELKTNPRGSDLPGQEEMDDPTQGGKGILHLSAFLFYLGPLTNCMMVSSVNESGSSLPSPLTSIPMSSGNIVRDTPRNNAVVLSGYPLAQSSWHIKFTLYEFANIFSEFGLSFILFSHVFWRASF